jgi:UPF0755 protein
MPPRPQPKARPRRSAWRALVWLGSAALTALGAFFIAVFAIIAEAHRPGPATQPETFVVIPRGAGVVSIAERLGEAGVIRSPLVFRAAAQLYAEERGMKAGEYAVPAGASMRAIIELIESGRVVLHPISIPEGLTSAMVVERLAAAEVLTGATPAIPPEGAILPDTYRVTRGMDRSQLLARMVSEREKLLERLWAQRASDLPIKTPAEAVILASIVERETGIAHERPRVAAVFVNRLRQGMRLESDPTIIYGVSQGRPLGRGITRSELDTKTPYNTYLIDGLPPTPIANPGREALAAVLNPPTTTDLFFVADGTGGHAFAATYAEHQRNVARWREIERAAAAAR